MLTFDSKEIHYYSLMDGNGSNYYALNADVGIIVTKTLSTNSYFILMMSFTVLLLILFIIFPVFLLMFYPIKMFRSLLSRCLCNRFQIILNIFIERFHCCFKDGLDGTKDMRSFSGIYFLLRIVAYNVGIFGHATLHLGHQLSRGFMFLAAALLIALSQPYKKTYMNVVDSLLLSHMASLCYITASTSTEQNKSWLFLPLIQLMIAFPFIILFLVTTYRMIYGIFKRHLFSMQCFSRLKMASLRMKLCDRLFSSSRNLTLPETTYGAINY